LPRLADGYQVGRILGYTFPPSSFQVFTCRIKRHLVFQFKIFPAKANSFQLISNEVAGHGC